MFRMRGARQMIDKNAKICYIIRSDLQTSTSAEKREISLNAEEKTLFLFFFSLTSRRGSLSHKSIYGGESEVHVLKCQDSAKLTPSTCPSTCGVIQLSGCH